MLLWDVSFVVVALDAGVGGTTSMGAWFVYVSVLGALQVCMFFNIF